MHLAEMPRRTVLNQQLGRFARMQISDRRRLERDLRQVKIASERLNNALQIEEVEHGRLGGRSVAPELRPAAAGEDEGESPGLVRQLVANLRQIHGSDFEETDVPGVPQIRGGHFQHTREHAVPHHDALGGDRVLDADIVGSRQAERGFALRHRQ